MTYDIQADRQKDRQPHIPTHTSTLLMHA